MMSLWDALRMNMMISYQELVRTFLRERVVDMKRSRTEVGRWRMLRQVSRRKARWLEAQSRRNMRIHAIRKCGLNRHRNALLFAVQDI